MACYRSQRVIKQSLMRRNPAKRRVQVNSGTPFPEFCLHFFGLGADASAAKTDAIRTGMGCSWRPSRVDSRARAGCWADMIALFMDKLSGKRMRKTGNVRHLPLCCTFGRAPATPTGWPFDTHSMTFGQKNSRGRRGSSHTCCCYL